jgi:hypothetical protein
VAYGGFAGVCVQERVRNASSVFFLEMVPKKHFFQTYISTITAVKTWCDSETSWLIAQAWWTIWKPVENLVKTWWISKTWWTSGAFPKPGEFQNLVKDLVNFQKLGEHVGYFENVMNTWWKPGECQNLVKTWWKPGENLVKTWWKLGEFTRFSQGF